VRKTRAPACPSPTRQAAERPLLLLQFDQVALAHHGKRGQRGDGGDRRGIETLQGLGEVGCVALGMRNLLRQPYRQRRLSFVSGTGFKIVEIFGHGLLRS
jgi:hypothetical protein